MLSGAVIGYRGLVKEVIHSIFNELDDLSAQVIATGGYAQLISSVLKIVLAIVMLIYETLGGMRSVAWTDVTQGIILLLSLGFIAFALFFHGVVGFDGMSRGKRKLIICLNLVT